MDKKDKVTKVEELLNFPFPNYAEFKKANFEGVIQPGVDRGLALRWAQNGIHASKFLSFQVFIYSLLPWICLLSFIAYCLLSKSWLLLFASPLFLIAFFVLHPSAVLIFGGLRKILVFLLFVLFVWGLLNNRTGATVLSGGLLITWHSLKAVYNKSVNSLIAALTIHEDLLCSLWQCKGLNIRFYNGNTYWLDWKIESGKTTHYEDKS
jgi:hypothetical protein